MKFINYWDIYNKNNIYKILMQQQEITLEVQNFCNNKSVVLYCSL